MSYLSGLKFLRHFSWDAVYRLASKAEDVRVRCNRTRLKVATTFTLRTDAHIRA